MTMYRIGGAIFWNGVNPPGAVADVPMLMAYRRDLAASLLTRIPAMIGSAITQGRSVRLRPQDCVPGKSGLVPATVPTATINDTVVPRYNSVEYLRWFTQYHAALHAAITSANTANIPVLIDFGFGKWGEGHGAGDETPTAQTLLAMLATLHGLYGKDRIVCCTDSQAAMLAHNELGGRWYFRDSLGDIETPSHFAKPFVNPATADILKRGLVLTEPIRKSSLADFSVQRATEQFSLYPSIVGVANANGDFDQRTGTERTAYAALLRRANERAVTDVAPPIIVSPPPPPPPADPFAQIVLLKTQLADAENVIEQKTSAIATLKAEIATLNQRIIDRDQTIQTLMLRNTRMTAALTRLLAATDEHTTALNQLREMMKASG